MVCHEGGGRYSEGGGKDWGVEGGKLRFERLGEVSRFLRALGIAVGVRFRVKRVKTKRGFVERMWCDRGGCCIRRCPR